MSDTKVWRVIAILSAVIGVTVGSFGAVQAQTSQVTYSQILSAPDDLALNVRFLEAQLAGGDFAGAAVTLQRILLINPDFDEARLIRVAVFLRLGDHAGASDDLAYLERRPLSADQRAEAANLASMVRGSAMDPRFSGVVRFGVLYDTNPGNSPGSGTVLAAPFSFNTDGRFGGFGELQFTGVFPFGGGLGHEFRVEGHGFARAHADGSRAHSYANLAAGPRFDLGFAFLDVMAIAGVEFVGSDHYGSRLGGRATLLADINDRLSASLRVEAAHDSVDVRQFAAGTVGDGDGWEYLARPAATYRLSDLWSVEAHALYASKETGSAWYSYDSFGGGLEVSFRNAAGYHLRVGGSVQNVEYDAVDPNFGVLTVPVREETRFQLDAAFAVPLREIVEAMGQGDGAWAQNWAVETFARYAVNQSNIASYDSSNLTVGVSFARRFSM